MYAAQFLAARLTSVFTLVCDTGNTEGRSYTNDFLQVLICFDGFPKLGKLCVRSMDCRSESHVKILLDSRRPISAISLPDKFESTEIPWRLSRITSIAVGVVFENCNIDIGDHQLENVKLE